MGDLTKVSVIVPVYNVEKYLDRCIESMVNQSYDNIEIILVDDGSTDKCSLICDFWKEKDARINVIHQINRGLSAARNAGLEVFNGEYVTFIDSDDYISYNYIEVLLELLLRCKADIAVANFRYIYEDNSGISKEANIYNTVKSGRDIILEERRGISYGISCAKLYKSALFENLRFPIGKYHEDEFVFYEVMWQASKVVCTNKALYYYLQRSNSIMGQGASPQKMRDVVEARKHRKLFFEEKGDKELLEDSIELYMNTIYSALITHKNCYRGEDAIVILQEYIDSLKELCRIKGFGKIGIRRLGTYVKNLLILKNILKTQKQ